MANVGAWVSLVAYVVLMAVKLFTGHLAHSQSLTADGLNNVTDVIGSVAVLVGIMIAQKPRDRDHPYGHYRAENVSALVISLIMATIGFQVLYGSVKSLAEGTVTQAPNPWAAWVGVLSAGIMAGVYMYNRELAKRTQSQALDAMAKDNLSDALVSLGSVVGILGAQLSVPWLDPLVAGLIAAIILKTAWGIFAGASHVLTDGFDESALVEYKRTIRQVAGVMSVGDVRGRWQGSNAVVDATINVDPQLTVAASHRIADRVEACLKAEHGVYKVFVHIEPAKAPQAEAPSGVRSVGGIR